LTKRGAGSLTLGGAINYSGDTTIDAGILAITGTMGISGTYAGNIVNNGSLTLQSEHHQSEHHPNADRDN
jgi:autotransporter-associated beta strand protein